MAQNVQPNEITGVRSEFDLLRVVAMELQQPLIHISGTTRLLAEGVLEKKELPLHFERLEISTQRMQHQLESILLAGQVESAQVQLEFEPVNPAAIVHQAVSDMRPLARTHGMRIVPHISQSLKLVSAHQTALRYSLINLLDVAVRSGKSKTIDVLVHNQNQSVMITIRDDSEVLPAASLETLIKNFGRASQPLKQLPVNASLGVYVAHVLSRHCRSSIHFHAEKGRRHISLNLPLSRQLSLSL